jgi:hypothetical protein
VATVVNYLGLFLVLCGFVVGAIGGYRSFVLHEMWRKEKGWWKPLLFDGWFEPNMSEEFRLSAVE